MEVHVVFVPSLVRHLAAGWSEDQLITGRVATLGRESLTLSLPVEGATLLNLAHGVEDAWGVAVEDQAFRWRGATLVPGAGDSGKRALTELGFPSPPARPARVLLSAGAPAPAGGGPAAPTGGLATAVRALTQVEVLTEEAPPPAPPPLVLRPPPGAPAAAAPPPPPDGAADGATAAPPPQPFAGQSRRLCDAAPHAADELSPAQRRERAAAAAAARAAASRGS
jgi:hypothetical protein